MLTALLFCRIAWGGSGGSVAPYATQYSRTLFGLETLGQWREALQVDSLNTAVDPNTGDVWYRDAEGEWSVTSSTAYGRGLLDLEDEASARSYIGSATAAASLLTIGLSVTMQQMLAPNELQNTFVAAPADSAITLTGIRMVLFPTDTPGTETPQEELAVAFEDRTALEESGVSIFAEPVTVTSEVQTWDANDFSHATLEAGHYLVIGSPESPGDTTARTFLLTVDFRSASVSNLTTWSDLAPSDFFQTLPTLENATAFREAIGAGEGGGSDSYIDVTDSEYGASDQDEEDDSTAIQAAIDAALSQHKGLIIRRTSDDDTGYYHIATPLTIGAGPTYAGIEIKAIRWPVLRYTGATGGTVLTCTGLAESTFNGALVIDGNSIADVNGVKFVTSGSAPSQRNTLSHLWVENCPGVGVTIKQVDGATLDYYSFRQCCLSDNGINLLVQGGARQVDWYDGAILSAGSYGIEIDAGGFKGYGAFFGLNGTSDIHLNGSIVGLHTYGCNSESNIILTNSAAAESGSQLLGPIVFSGFTQDATPPGDAVTYSGWQPIKFDDCKFAGNVNLSSNVQGAVSIGTRFYPGGDFTGACAHLTRILPESNLINIAGNNVLDASAIGSTVQAQSEHLADLADGSLTGSKVGTGIDGDNLTSGTVADARVASTLARDSEVTTAVGTHLSTYGHISATAVAKTGNYTIQASETGTLFTTGGATGNVDFTLPAATVGMIFGATRTADVSVRLYPASGEKYVGKAANVSFRFDATETIVSVRCFTTGVWTVTSQYGLQGWE